MMHGYRHVLNRPNSNFMTTAVISESQPLSPFILQITGDEGRTHQDDAISSYEKHLETSPLNLVSALLYSRLDTIRVLVRWPRLAWLGSARLGSSGGLTLGGIGCPSSLTST